MCVYRLAMPLTASKIAVCTMAAPLVTLSGLVAAITFARSICSVQPVTSSARAVPGPRVAAAMNAAATAFHVFILPPPQSAGHVVATASRIIRARTAGIGSKTSHARGYNRGDSQVLHGQLVRRSQGRRSGAVHADGLHCGAADAVSRHPEIRPVDTYFGVRVADPYRWLEDETSPETATWVEAENKVTFAYLDAIPYRPASRSA